MKNKKDELQFMKGLLEQQKEAFEKYKTETTQNERDSSVKLSKIWGTVILGIMAMIGAFFGKDGYTITGLVIATTCMFSLWIFGNNRRYD